MYQWLCADLAATDQDFIIAFWHHPPYTKGSHDSDNAIDSNGIMQEMRERFLPVLDAYGVDLVLTGHSHSYERSLLLHDHYGVSSTLQSGAPRDRRRRRRSGRRRRLPEGRARPLARFGRGLLGGGELVPDLGRGAQPSRHAGEPEHPRLAA